MLDSLLNIYCAVRWIVGGFAILFSLGCACANIHIAYNYYRRGRNASMITLVGGGLGALGLVVLPTQGALLPGLWQYAWIPLIADIGCLPLLLGFVGRPRQNDS